mmetsp:Transcript_3380/g.7634  ORF Transcript_3380/g.7634 Transcript_3380/m.7634 type:complete len:202 (-) Transcript_3380:362-967(-)
MPSPRPWTASESTRTANSSRPGTGYLINSSPPRRMWPRSRSGCRRMWRLCACRRRRTPWRGVQRSKSWWRKGTPKPRRASTRLTGNFLCSARKSTSCRASPRGASTGSLRMWARWWRTWQARDPSSPPDLHAVVSETSSWRYVLAPAPAGRTSRPQRSSPGASRGHRRRRQWGRQIRAYCCGLRGGSMLYSVWVWGRPTGG